MSRCIDCAEIRCFADLEDKIKFYCGACSDSEVIGQEAIFSEEECDVFKPNSMRGGAFHGIRKRRLGR